MHNRYKRNLLFVIDSLNVAGAEKSLVTLLSLLDYSRFSVDLMMFGHGGLLEGLLPSEVNMLKPLEYTKFTGLKIKEALKYSFQNADFRMINSRLKYSFKIRKQKYSNPQKARIFWESVSSVIEDNSKIYDIAISYAQGIPTFYVADKVKAKEKFAWVNVSYRLDHKESNFQNKFYNHYKKIVAVSDSTKEVFIETFPYYSNKIEVIYDINNPDFITRMANLGESYNDNFPGLRILTIGRLANQKGYDLALKTCLKLKNKGIKFRWYALGIGPHEQRIKDYIKKYDLSDYFVLLGVKANPYPFIKNADIYVQTSRYEGYGLAIAEARMLNIPVVTTKFDAVYNQMIDGGNGLVVEMDAESVCEGILKMINEIGLKEKITSYLRNEKKGNVEEIEKFYQLIDSKNLVRI